MGRWDTTRPTSRMSKPLGAPPVRRLIIGHLLALLRSPTELRLRGSAVYFWSHCCLPVCFHLCSLAVLLPVQRSEIYSWCRGQWFMAGFSRTWPKTVRLQPYSDPILYIYILALDLFNEAETLRFLAIYVYIGGSD